MIRLRTGSCGFSDRTGKRIDHGFRGTVARLNEGRPLKAPFREVDKVLRELLVQFGPPRKTYLTEYHIWRLQNDGIWELLGGER